MVNAELEAGHVDVSKTKLLEQLQEGSPFLEAQNDSLRHIWDKFEIVSFYETHLTPAVKRVPLPCVLFGRS